MKFEEQLSSDCSRTIEENSSVNNDEDLNVFEVEHSNFCHTALIYNDDGDEVDKHGNTQWVLSGKKESQDGEYFECKL